MSSCSSIVFCVHDTFLVNKYLVCIGSPNVMFGALYFHYHQTHSLQNQIYHSGRCNIFFPQAPTLPRSKCGLSGGFSTLPLIQSRIFTCPTFLRHVRCALAWAKHTFQLSCRPGPSVNTRDMDGKQTGGKHVLDGGGTPSFSPAPCSPSSLLQPTAAANTPSMALA